MSSLVHILNFKVLIQITLAERTGSGGETFELIVCSPNKLAETEPGLFINNTLVIEKFDWDVIKNRIRNLLSFCRGSSSWKEVILKLSGYLKYSDGEIWEL